LASHQGKDGMAILEQKLELQQLQVWVLHSKSIIVYNCAVYNANEK